MPFYILDKNDTKKNEISQFFGYALVNFFTKEKANLSLVKEEPFKITNFDDVNNHIESSLVFSSHYIEESLYYKAYESSNWDKSIAHSFLQDAYLQGSKKYYALGLTLDEEKRQPLFIEEETISVFFKEQDIFIEYPMAKHKLLGYFDDNGVYVYIHVAFDQDVVSGVPALDNEEKKETNPMLFFSSMYDKIISDALSLKILSKLD